MKKLGLVMMLAICLGASVSPVFAEGEATNAAVFGGAETTAEVEAVGQNDYTNDSKYVLRVGDALSIAVENKLDARVYTVGPDGIFSMGLLGDVDVRGKTIPMLKKELTLRYTEYVKDPNVLINLTRSGNMPIYVFGAVAQQGIIGMGKSLSLLDVISKAGLTNKSAKRKVALIHYGEEEPYMIVNVQKLIRGEKGAQNPTLQPGDRVYVHTNKKIIF